MIEDNDFIDKASYLIEKDYITNIKDPKVLAAVMKKQQREKENRDLLLQREKGTIAKIDD